MPKPTAANQSWSMDFVAYGLADGRKLQWFAIVDDHRRECLAIEVDTTITGTRVTVLSASLISVRCQVSITVDHGPEFEDQVFRRLGG